jgi:hypothetical protein
MLHSKWTMDSYGTAFLVLFVGTVIALVVAIPLGWLGLASMAGPVLGAALFGGYHFAGPEALPADGDKPEGGPSHG